MIQAQNLTRNKHALAGKLSWKNGGRNDAAVHAACHLLRTRFWFWCNSVFAPDLPCSQMQNLALHLHRVGVEGRVGLSHALSEKHIWNSCLLPLIRISLKNKDRFLVCSLSTVLSSFLSPIPVCLSQHPKAQPVEVLVCIQSGICLSVLCHAMCQFPSPPSTPHNLCSPTSLTRMGFYI